MKDKRSAYDAASKSSFEQHICGSQSQSQLIGSGQAKNWTRLQLTDVLWDNILANSIESVDSYILYNYIAT